MISGRYLEPMWLGLALLTLGSGLLINLDANSSLGKLIVYQIILGIGSGPQFQCPILALQATARTADVGVVTATSGFVRAIAAAVSTVVGGVIFQNGLASHHSQLVTALGAELAGDFSGAEADVNVLSIGSLPADQQRLVQGAYASSLSTMWILYTCVAAAAGIASIFVESRVLTKEHEEVKTGLAAEAAKSEQAAMEMQTLKSKS